MKAECGNCGQKYTFNPDKLKTARVRVKCQVCGDFFVVRKPGSGNDAGRNGGAEEPVLEVLDLSDIEYTFRPVDEHEDGVFDEDDKQEYPEVDLSLLGALIPDEDEADASEKKPEKPEEKRVLDPAFSPAGGTFTKHQEVTISCGEPDAVIHYTLNGSTPTQSSNIYDAPITVSKTATIKARAFKTGYTYSRIITEAYKISGVVKNPAFSLKPGTFSSGQKVEITCSTTDAEIYYSIDGSEPTKAFPLYSKPVEINASATMKAKAFKTDWEPSETVGAYYEITGAAAAPVFSVPAGTYTATQSVVLNCATPESNIYYTLDGSEPTEKSALYEKPLEVAESSNIKAKAYRIRWEPSKTVSALFIIAGTVSTPKYSLKGGTYTRPQTLAITCATPEARIHYSTMGNHPTEDSPIYEDPIEVKETMTVHARAFLKDWVASEMAVESYKITGTAATPVSKPLPGAFTTEQIVFLSCTTPEASIHYTLDGSEPTVKSLRYTQPIHLKRDTTTVIRARAFKVEWNPSDIGSGTFKVTGTAAKPYFATAPGIYTDPIAVVLECATPNAVVRYSLDGTDPTEQSPEYTGPIEIHESATLSARAFRPEWVDSPIARAEYRITGRVESPTVSLAPGVYTTPRVVELGCDTSDSMIRYTLDGSEPNENSFIYKGPIPLDIPTTVTAVAEKEDWGPSFMIQAVYKITGTVPRPAFSPHPGIYTKGQTVTITCPDEDAEIRYTLDGVEPSEDSSLYKKPFSASKSCVICARAFRTDWDPSDTVVGKYKITGKLPPPYISLKSGTYTSARTVAVTNAKPDSDIHYTLDGSDPTMNSPKYEGSLEIEETAILSTKAFLQDWEPSDTVQANYGITGTVSPPEFDPAPGLHEGEQRVGIFCDTPDAKITYTLDGIEPTEKSAVYTKRLEIYDTTRISAKAFRERWAPSRTVSGLFEITGEVAKPVFSPPPGDLTAGDEVALSCSTRNAVIRYTVDGHIPTEDSPEYKKPIVLMRTTIVSAKAFKPGWRESPLGAGSYKVTGTVAPVEFSLESKTYTSPQKVALACMTGGADIHYEFDGKEPTEESPKYTGPLTVGRTLTLKARAFLPGWTPGEATKGVFTITGTVAEPTFSVKPGAYGDPFELELRCETPGAKIHYTTDGSEPDEDSPVYNDPITVDHRLIVAAKAFCEGWLPSEPAAGVYRIDPSLKEAQPVAAPPAAPKPLAPQATPVKPDADGALITPAVQAPKDSRFVSPVVVKPPVVKPVEPGTVASEKTEAVEQKPVATKPGPVEPAAEPVGEAVADEKPMTPPADDPAVESDEETEEYTVEELESEEEFEVDVVRVEKKKSLLSSTKPKPSFMPNKPGAQSGASRLTSGGYSSQIGSSTPVSQGRTPVSVGPVSDDSSLPVITGPIPDFIYVMNEEWFHDGEEVVTQGKYGNWLWVVLEGAVEVIRETPEGEISILRLGEGCYPGALASVLSREHVRTATTRAVGATCLGVLDMHKINMELTLVSDTFRGLLESLAARLTNVSDLAVNFYNNNVKIPDVWKKSEVVMKQGDDKAGLVKIVRGMAYVTRMEKKKPIILATLKKGDYFGRIPFMEFGHEPMDAAVYGSSDLQTLKIATQPLSREFEQMSMILRNIFLNVGKSMKTTTDIAMAFKKERKKK